MIYLKAIDNLIGDKMKYYVVDAFTDTIFKGNPAGVCLIPEFPDASLLQNIAYENNLSETAFVVNRGDYYELRWFTPESEIDLCGHATLASAFVVANFVNKNASIMNFQTMSGILTVIKYNDLYEMNFPLRDPTPIAITDLMKQAVGVPVLEAHLSRDMILLLENEQQVQNLSPNFSLIGELPDCFGLVVTAQGDTADFVSRYFAPNASIPEDPVTGSSHSSLIPFWSKRLNKSKMTARQLSQRGGTLLCEDCGDRVKISGNAVLYSEGDIKLNMN